MKQRTIEILRFCSLSFEMNEYYKRRTEWERLSSLYSQKAIWKKIEELESRGYVEIGTSPYTSWLTEKGKLVLEEV